MKMRTTDMASDVFFVIYIVLTLAFVGYGISKANSNSDQPIECYIKKGDTIMRVANEYCQDQYSDLDNPINVKEQ